MTDRTLTRLLVSAALAVGAMGVAVNAPVAYAEDGGKTEGKDKYYGEKKQGEKDKADGDKAKEDKGKEDKADEGKTEVEIEPADLPQAVRDAVARDYPGATIVEAEKETYADGTVHYEVELKKGEKTREVEYTVDGEELEEHEDDSGEAEDEHDKKGKSKDGEKKGKIEKHV